MDQSPFSALIVCDDPDQARRLGEMLARGREGACEFAHAASLAAARELITSGGFDALLVSLPGGAGRESLAGLSADAGATPLIALDELLQEGRFSATMLDTAEALVIILDAAGRVLRLNRAAEFASGYGQDEVRDRHFLDLFPVAAEQKAMAAALERLRQSLFPLKHESCWTGKHGARRLISWSSAALLDARGAVERLAVTGLDVTGHRSAEEALRAISLTDELTGLSNRRGFMTLALQQLKNAKRLKKPLALLFADVDNLKAINDRLGHLEGDAAIREAAAVFKETFREADIIARLGGDELLVLAFETSRTGADTMAARLTERVAAANRQPGRRYQLSLSVGLARYDPAAPRSLDELLREADERMYAAKQAKRQAGQV